MATKWVITAPSDRIDLDGTRQGQITFTVTNPTDRPDRVLFDVVPGDGADPTWFTVDEPQRRVPANGSVSYLVSTSVPTAVTAGTYSAQGRACSADATPEEDSVLSGRLMVQVEPKPVPVRRRRPWWILAVAGLVVVVVVVVLGVVLGRGSGPAPGNQQLVGVPNVARESEAQARTNLSVFGLRVGTVRHKVDATPDTVIYQSLAGGSQAPRGTAVDLVVTVNLAGPKVVAPIGGIVPLTQASPATTPVPTAPVRGQASPTPAPTGVMRWTDADAFVTRWRVTIWRQMCVAVTNGIMALATSCQYFMPWTVEVDHPWYTPALDPASSGLGANAGTLGALVYRTVNYQWQVVPVDDYGNAGTSSGLYYFKAE